MEGQFLLVEVHERQLPARRNAQPPGSGSVCILEIDDAGKLRRTDELDIAYNLFANSFAERMVLFASRLPSKKLVITGSTQLTLS